MRTLLTGAAGFIGAYAARALLARGESVLGLDNFNDYYEPQLKRDRTAALCPSLELITADVADGAALEAAFAGFRPQRVLHLAAQAGVRYSIQNPLAYAHSNLAGFAQVLDACRRHGVEHLVYASSSSVYGANAQPPFREDARVDQPLSYYAATKAANELMAESQARIHGLACTGLRFFTVYGPWGRPDMAPLLFARAALAGRAIAVYNHGRMRRDFTHVDDIVAGILAALDRDTALQRPPHRIYNLGNHRPEELERFIALIESAAGRPVQRDYLPLQAGDMIETMADIERARGELGFEPRTPLDRGLPPVVAWCRDYFGERA